MQVLFSDLGIVTSAGPVAAQTTFCRSPAAGF
jgi:hypothetical protein